MVPTPDLSRFYAIGRVFSGVVKPGVEVKIMGANYKIGKKGDMFMKKIQKTCIPMIGKMESFPEIPCGNIVSLVGIDNFLTKQGTISDNENAHCIRTMKFTVSPVVRVAVVPKKPIDLPKLVDGLKKLCKFDPLVQCYTEESGEHIIAGCGDLHVEICFNMLCDFSNCEIVMSEPRVTYRETVIEESPVPCLAKSANKHNRLFMTAEPLEVEVVEAIEKGEIVAGEDVKILSKSLVDLGWNPNDSKKVFCFGPEQTGPNLFVDQTVSV